MKSLSRNLAKFVLPEGMEYGVISIRLLLE